MSNDRHGDERHHGGVAVETISLEDSRRVAEAFQDESTGRPSLRARTIDQTTVVRFVNAEILFEERAIHTVGRQLHRLIEEERHTRLVVNFAGVRYLSSEVLGILAGLHREVNPARGRIVLCGLDPLLRDMVRITHLDRVFDVYGDEAEALGGCSADGVDGVAT
jgi:anti-sigma B factor antagonist